MHNKNICYIFVEDWLERAVCFFHAENKNRIMKTETKEIYKCEHCNKLYQLKNWCLVHEKACSKNPDNDRACFGCQYLTKQNETI